MSKILATPAARVAAKEKNIDLSTVKGSGKLGAIVLKDLDNVAVLVEKDRGVKVTPVAKNAMNYYDVSLDDVAHDGNKVKKQDVLNAVNSPAAQTSEEVKDIREVTRKPMTGMRKTIADNMMSSLTNMAQYTNVAELDTTKLMSVFKDIKQTYKNAGRRLTITDVMIKIVSLALKKNPIFNQTFEDNEIVSYPYVNMGLAVALDEGLIVPTIFDADTKSLAQISEDRSAVVDKARNNKLKPNDYKGATFTISNMGNSPVSYFTPVINPPQVAILGIGKTEDKLYMDDGEVKVKTVTYFSVTSDHRVVDGIEVGKFLSTLEELLADPYCILL